MGGAKPPPVPDYREFKVEGIPKLEEVQRHLKARGLKDPWLRNEAWRFGEGYTTPGVGALRTVFRGFKWGFAAFVVTIAVEKMFKKDDHGHH
ncbi:NADH dehydrogenase [ubiquinone] 1 beta subcomplex subunit 3-like [Lineus longissimus]|uniref:NADH dehydrogenase [ubiquinone] 1 beta subcomplex subunit 3-like n=1 Tax=Lineus longissimus TaxID=88925 RepID=UPI00315D2D53